MLLPSAAVKLNVPPRPTAAVTPPSCVENWLICAATADVVDAAADGHVAEYCHSVDGQTVGTGGRAARPP